MYMSYISLSKIYICCNILVDAVFNSNTIPKIDQYASHHDVTIASPFFSRNIYMRASNKIINTVLFHSAHILHMAKY